MHKLTLDSFNRAKEYLNTFAEPIDKALYEYYFEGKTSEHVIDVLGLYQNQDGGFGYLDYDIECPVSCLKHTESACRYIFALETVPENHVVIRNLISYLEENYNELTGEWNNVLVPEINNYPRAYWWNYEEKEIHIPKDRHELIERYNPVVNATLAGMLIRYGKSTSQELKKQLIGIITDKIILTNTFTQYHIMSENFFIGQVTDMELKKKLLGKVMGGGQLIKTLDDHWGTENAYKLVNWITSPSHPYYELYKESVDMNLNFLIENQDEDGGWSPSWSWGEQEVWERVSKRLKGVLTVYFLHALKCFNRIEVN